MDSKNNNDVSFRTVLNFGLVENLNSNNSISKSINSTNLIEKNDVMSKMIETKIDTGMISISLVSDQPDEDENLQQKLIESTIAIIISKWSTQTSISPELFLKNLLSSRGYVFETIPAFDTKFKK